MTTESGGNPTIVNRWDSNWLAGTPSVGLMQVIGPTFRTWAGPFRNTGPFEYGVSVNGLANIFAGLNYAIHRYGAGWTSVLGHGHGYDSGGWLMPGPVNGTGQPEAVLTPGQSDAFLALAEAASNPAMASKLDQVIARLERLVRVAERAPGLTGAALSEALNTGSRRASYLAAYSAR
jgi:SLT domain-containing protein